MAKANINLPNGTKIVIDGTADEINAILKLYSSSAPSSESHPKKSRTQLKKQSKKSSGTKKSGPKQYIRDLRTEGFFDKKRTINDVQKNLEQNGHIYPLTHLSTPLRVLVQEKELGRMKEDGNWVYFKR